ncbi:hypothetical protein AB0K00_51795 [Dactylosporangium sp. NPDC049525]|uniref:hypothetical protein n=1 Tax=Dactylosporangium sp. NPDC049525 TaxID=3154730 RepID=UPI003443E956
MTDDEFVAPAASLPERAHAVFPLIAQWIFSEPMAELLAAFDQRLPAPGAPWDGAADDAATWLHLDDALPEAVRPIFDEGVVALAGLSPEQTDTLRRTLAIERMAAGPFNFRANGAQYRERSQVAMADFVDGLRERILVLADGLGLGTPQPPRRRRYDRTLILGGGYQSPQLRTRHAAQLRAGGIDLGQISLLGSPRFLMVETNEAGAVQDYAPDAVDEFDLMIGAARTEFGLRPEPVRLLCGCAATDQLCPSWLSLHITGGQATPPQYTHERTVELLDGSGRPVAVALSAHTSRPPYRPDTGDTLALWSRLAGPRAGEQVLLVTSQPFVPFQVFDSLRRLYLPHGLDIDVVAFPPEWSDRFSTAESFLQETLSAIRSARRLLVDATVALTPAAPPSPGAAGER